MPWTYPISQTAPFAGSVLEFDGTNIVGAGGLVPAAAASTPPAGGSVLQFDGTNIVPASGLVPAANVSPPPAAGSVLEYDGTNIIGVNDVLRAIALQGSFTLNMAAFNPGESGIVGIVMASGMLASDIITWSFASGFTAETIDVLMSYMFAMRAGNGLFNVIAKNITAAATPATIIHVNWIVIR